ncbi:rhodanese-like domain-containing protein [Thermodesulfobacteriota bacterium]
MLRKIAIFILLVVIVLAITHKKTLAEGNLITPEKVKELIDNKADIVLLDVRTAQEHNAAHIKGVKLIPIKEIPKRLGEIPKDKDVIVLCAVGGRSAQATKFLLDNGFTKIRDMQGGMKAWQKKGFPVEK